MATRAGIETGDSIQGGGVSPIRPIGARRVTAGDLEGLVVWAVWEDLIGGGAEFGGGNLFDLAGAGAENLAQSGCRRGAGE